MRYLLLADIHSNLEALQAVLKDAKSKDYRRIICLGDTVGYNANPNECLDILRKEKDTIFIMGNHDAGAVGLLDLDEFPGQVGQCLAWTQKQLNKENHALLKGLPYFFSNEFMIACHGSPKNFLWEYMDTNAAKESLKMITEQLLVVGHTHEAFYYQQGFKVSQMVALHDNIDFARKRTVVSLPSVGQPRDDNPLTGYGILDLDNRLLEIHRLKYDIEKAAKKIIGAGLPEWEAERLLLGK